MDLNHLNLRVADPDACRGFYTAHFGFRAAFEAGAGHFVRNDEGFLLALLPTADHQPLPPGFHVGFAPADPAAVELLHRELVAAASRRWRWARAGGSVVIEIAFA